MLFDHLKNKENYRQLPYLYQALCWLDALEPGSLPESQTILIPDVLFCNPVSFTSRPEEECRYEAHRRFLDLHYIVEGVEGIATADVSTLHTLEEYSAQKDIQFLKGEEDGRYYLKPGQFMVCWPNDAHKVGMMKDAPAPIKKVVFKIRYEAD